MSFTEILIPIGGLFSTFLLQLLLSVFLDAVFVPSEVASSFFIHINKFTEMLFAINAHLRSPGKNLVQQEIEKIFWHCLGFRQVEEAGGILELFLFGHLILILLKKFFCKLLLEISSLEVLICFEPWS